jgi:hypothetical protein
MWELFVYGALPYAAMNNLETMDAVLKGYRLPKPDECPESIWQIIVRCWLQASSACIKWMGTLF